MMDWAEASFISILGSLQMTGKGKADVIAVHGRERTAPMQPSIFLN